MCESGLTPVGLNMCMSSCDRSHSDKTGLLYTVTPYRLHYMWSLLYHNMHAVLTKEKFYTQYLLSSGRRHDSFSHRATGTLHETALTGSPE